MKPTIEDVETKLRAAIVEQVGGTAAAIMPESKFTDLGFDSLDAVELAIAAEDEFGISIADEEFETLKTFQEAVAALAKKLGLAAS